MERFICPNAAPDLSIEFNPFLLTIGLYLKINRHTAVKQ